MGGDVGGPAVTGVCWDPRCRGSGGGGGAAGGQGPTQSTRPMWGRWGDPITAGGQGRGLLVSPSLGVWQLWGHWGCCWRPVVVSLICCRWMLRVYRDSMSQGAQWGSGPWWGPLGTQEVLLSPGDYNRVPGGAGGGWRRHSWLPGIVVCWAAPWWAAWQSCGLWGTHGGTTVTTRMGPPPGPHRAARWPCTPRHPSPPQAVGGHTGDVPYWGLKVQSHDVAGKDDFGLRFGCSLVWCTALGFRLEAVEVADEIQIQSLRWGGVLLPRSVTRGGSLLLLPAPSCCLLREEQLCHLTGTAPRPAPAHVAWGRVTFASCDSRTSPSRLRSEVPFWGDVELHCSLWHCSRGMGAAGRVLWSCSRTSETRWSCAPLGLGLALG